MIPSQAEYASKLVLVIALTVVTSAGRNVEADEPTPSMFVETDRVLSSIRELESARDPKCHSTACRFEDFIYGTPLTAEARELKVSLQKALVLHIIQEASDLASAAGRSTATKADVSTALDRLFRTAVNANGNTIVSVDGAEPLEISAVRLRQIGSIAYALRAILSVQQDALLFGPPLMPLDASAIETLQVGINTATLCALETTDREARLANEQEISPERLHASWRRLFPNSSSDSKGASQRAPRTTVTTGPREQFLTMIDGKLKAYLVYNETTPARGQQRFLKNVKDYYSLYMTPKHETWTTRLMNAYGGEMVRFARALVEKAQHSADEAGRALIRSSDATSAVTQLLPHEVDEFEDVTFFKHLPDERLTLESYDCDSFRDTGFHWEFFKRVFSSDESLMLPDPFAAEILTEAISNYGVLLWRVAGQVANDRQDAPALRPSHLEEARRRIIQFAELHHQTPGEPTSDSTIVSAHAQPIRASQQFLRLSASPVAFEHSSSPWLHEFRRASVSSYPTFSGGGVAAEDVNGDGHTDLLFVGGQGNALYLGDGRGGFGESSVRFSFTREDGTPGEARQPLIVDFDNDGDQDVFISYANNAHRLYRNDGGMQFVDVTSTAGLGGEGLIGGPATAFDFDNDGLVDVYITYFGDYLNGASPTEDRNNRNALPNRLLRNMGALQFEDATKNSDADDTGWCQAVSHVDFDRDGRQDIIVANDFGRNALLRNLGGGKFKDVATALGHTKAFHSMNVGITDLNQDGFPDIYVSNIATMVKDNKYTFPDVNTPKKLDLSALSNMLVKEANMLYVSEVNAGQLSGYAPSHNVERGESSTGWAWDAEFFDADNDGDDDLYVTNGTNDYNVFSKIVSLGRSQQAQHIQLTNRREANVFYLNDAGKLNNRSSSSGADFAANSRSTAYLDWDEDGDLDIAINNFHGPAVLLENRQPPNNGWLKVRLVGAPSVGTNLDCIGARILVTSSEGLYVAREVQAGSGYLSQNPKEQHFGLGKAQQVDLTVHWPDGETEHLYGVSANKSYVIERN